MALQIIVTTDDVSERAKGGKLTLKCQLFAEGVDTETEPPLFETTRSADIKSFVEGKTDQNLVDEARDKAGVELKEAVLVYRRIQRYTDMVDTKPVKDSIAAELAKAEVI